MDKQPLAVAGFVDVGVAAESEGEVEAGREHVAAALAEQAADVGHEPGQGHGILVAVGEADIAQHHQQTGCALGGLIPALVVEGLAGRDGELQGGGRVDLVENLNLVVVQLLVFQGDGLALLGLGRDDETLGVFAVADGDGGVGHELDFLLEGPFVLGQRLLLAGGGGCLAGGSLLFAGGGLRLALGILPLAFLGIAVVALGLVEALVGFLEERDVVVEFLEAERAVEVEVAVVGDGVAEVGAVFQLCAAHPVVVGGIADVGIHPVEDGQQVEGQLVGEAEVLLIVEGRSQVLDAGPHRVFPGGIGVGIEVFVDGCVGLLDLCTGAAVEVHVEVLGEVPPQGELAVPEELLVEGQGQHLAREVVHVALLQLVVVAGDLAVVGDALG